MTAAGIQDLDDLHLVFEEGEGKGIGLPLLDTVKIQKALRLQHFHSDLVQKTEEVRGIDRPAHSRVQATYSTCFELAASSAGYRHVAAFSPTI